MARRLPSGKTAYELLKKPADDANFLRFDYPRPLSQTLPKRRRILTNSAQREKSTKQLLGILERARSLKEASEKVLQNLETTRDSSLEDRGLCIETARDVLDNLKSMYLEVYDKHRILTARLAEKGVGLAVVGDMFGSLLRELQENQEAIARDVHENITTPFQRNKYNDFETEQEINTSSEESEYRSLMKKLKSTQGLQVEDHEDDMPGKLKFAEAFLANIRKRSEMKKANFLLKRQEMATKFTKLKKMAREVSQGAELSYQSRLKFMADTCQEVLMVNNELFSAKSQLISLEAETRALEISLEDNSLTESEYGLNNAVLDRLSYFCTALRNIELPRRQYRKLCVQLYQLLEELRSMTNLVTLVIPSEAETQTYIDCTTLKRAISNHATALRNKESSKKRKLLKRATKPPIVIKEKKKEAN